MAASIINPITKSPSFRAARWFLGDCVLRFWGRLFLITGLGLGSAALQGAALVLLNTALASSNGSAPFRVAIPVLSLHGNIPLAVSLIMAALMLSVFLAYAQGRQVLQLWQAYQINVVNRVYRAVQGAVMRGVDVAVIDEAPTLKVLRLSQRLGAFTRVIASSIAPGLRFIVFGAVAVIINPVLTIILVLVTVPSGGLALLFFARKSSQSARRVAALSQDAGRELERMLKRSIQGDEKAVMPEAGTVSSPFAEKMCAVTDRLLYVEQAKFSAGLIAMASIGFFIGRELIETPDGVVWGPILVYVVALLLAFRQLVIVTSAVSSFGRFYPAVQAQHELVDALEKASSSDDFRARLRRSSIGKMTIPDDDMLEEDL